MPNFFGKGDWLCLCGPGQLEIVYWIEIVQFPSSDKFSFWGGEYGVGAIPTIDCNIVKIIHSFSTLVFLPVLYNYAQAEDIVRPAPAEAVSRARLAQDGCTGEVAFVVYHTVSLPRPKFQKLQDVIICPNAFE